MPILNWVGKDKVVNHDKELPYRVLKFDPKLSTSDKSDSLIIQGDNLEALKSLIPFYYRSVDCIYIDPPYNTNTDTWIYSDKVNSPQIKEWINKTVGSEGEDLCRHDKWLCMMYPRLKLLKQLLSDKGVIFISIDDNELANLKTICDEIFGIQHLLGVFTWVRKKKGSNLSKKSRKITEYVLAYKSSDENITLFGSKAYAEKQVPLLNRPNRINELNFQGGVVRVSKGLEDGTISAGEFGTGELKVTLNNDIKVKGGVITSPFSLMGRFRWSQDTVDSEIEAGSIFTASPTFRINVARHNQAEKFKSPTSLLSPDEGIGTNEDATAELRAIFPELEKLPFDYPKPVSLIKYLLNAVLAENKDALILDSFAGSGTTGQAVLELNKDDEGSRKFILVELEDHIAKQVTAPRIKRVINGYKNATYPQGTGGSFKYLNLNGELFASNGFINAQCEYNDLAAYIYYVETRRHIDVEKISTPYIGSLGSKDYYLVFKKTGDSVLDENLAKTVSAPAKTAIVYADKTLLDDEKLAELGIIFKQIPYEIKKY